ncbi:MAG: DUF72 domain-containing protein, partial [Candidatus Bathyarchaeia archaeon]
MQSFYSSISALENKLAPIIIQLPPSMTFDNFEPLVDLVELLPWEQRHAIEFRHKSWQRDEVLSLL